MTSCIGQVLRTCRLQYFKSAFNGNLTKKMLRSSHCKLGITKTGPTPQFKSPCSSNNLGNIVVTKHLGKCILCYFFLCVCIHVFSPSSTSLVGLVLSSIHFPVVFPSSFCFAFYLFLQHHLLLPIIFSSSFVLLFPSSPASFGSSSSFSIFFPFFLCFNFSSSLLSCFFMCLFFPSFDFSFPLLCLVFSFLYLLLHYLLPQSFNFSLFFFNFLSFFFYDAFLFLFFCVFLYCILVQTTMTHSKHRC